MNGSTFLFVALASGVGACTRFRVDRGIQRTLSSRGEPAGAKLGILVVDVIRCFLAGAATQPASASLMPIASTGFLDGFTMFSTTLMGAMTLWADGFRGRNLVLALNTWTASWDAALADIACAGQSFITQLRPLCGLMGEGLAAIRSFVTAFRTLATLTLIC